jgi:hypothetical protein
MSAASSLLASCSSVSDSLLLASGSALFCSFMVCSALLCSALFCSVCYIGQSDGLRDTLIKGYVSRFDASVASGLVAAGTALVLVSIFAVRSVMRYRVNVFNCHPENDGGTWLSSRCLAMDARSDADIPAFRRHATILLCSSICYSARVAKSNDKISPELCTSLTHLLYDTRAVICGMTRVVHP